MIKLIEKAQNYRVMSAESSEPIQLVGTINGCNLLWARAKFDHDSIQINKFNKLQVEIFSKLGAPIKISSIELRMSQGNLS